MNSNEIPLVSLGTLNPGVKRPPVDLHSGSDTRESRARSWHTSRFSNKLPPYRRRHSRDAIGLTRLGGAFSAEVDSTPVAFTELKSKRPSEDALESAIPTKRLRTCDRDPDLEVDIPARKVLRFASPLCSSMYAPPSSLSRWQSPRTSPLGPRTSTYSRRSRESLQPSRGPSKASPSLLWRCVLGNFSIDNSSRNPYDQSAQWCEDLHLAGLKDIWHPAYGCPHHYHPSDPEYDEEWPDESWSDEEWSDSEDTLPTSDEDRAEADVRIVVSPEESPPQARSSETFKFVHWNSWGSHPSSHSSVFHSPHSWDAPDSLGRDAKERNGGTFSEPPDIVAAV